MFANALKIPMPVRDVLVRDPGGHVEHDNAALALNVVAVSETTEFLLPCGIPHVEADSAEVGEECERVDLHSQRRYWE